MPLTHVLPLQRNLTLNHSEIDVIHYDESFRYNRALWSTPNWEQGDPSLLMAILFSKHSQPTPAPTPKPATAKPRARVMKVTYPPATDQSASAHNTPRPQPERIPRPCRAFNKGYCSRTQCR